MDFIKSTLPENPKLVIGYVLGSIVFIFCIIVAIYAGNNPLLQLLICFAGGTLGWTLGILASPLSESEKSQFSDLSKALVALSTGFVIAKLEPAIVKSLSESIQLDSSLILLRVALFSLPILLGLLFTFVNRLYGELESERQDRKKRELYLKAGKIRDELNKLLEHDEAPAN